MKRLPFSKQYPNTVHRALTWSLLLTFAFASGPVASAQAPADPGAAAVARRQQPNPVLKRLFGSPDGILIIDPGFDPNGPVNTFEWTEQIDGEDIAVRFAIPHQVITGAFRPADGSPDVPFDMEVFAFDEMDVSEFNTLDHYQYGEVAGRVTSVSGEQAWVAWELVYDDIAGTRAAGFVPVFGTWLVHGQLFILPPELDADGRRRARQESRLAEDLLSELLLGDPNPCDCRCQAEKARKKCRVKAKAKYEECMARWGARGAGAMVGCNGLLIGGPAGIGPWLWCKGSALAGTGLMLGICRHERNVDYNTCEALYQIDIAACPPAPEDDPQSKPE